MAGETPVTIIGNLTADPELRFTPAGVAVADFTVASTPRVYDRESGEWKDGTTLFMRASIWREYAENVAASLHKGDRVIVVGSLTQRSYETREGENRTVVELQATEVGPALRRATATIQRVTSRTEGDAPQFGQRQAPQRQEAETPRRANRGPATRDEAGEKPPAKARRQAPARRPATENRDDAPAFQGADDDWI